VPPFRLRILRILDFQPTDAVAFINAVFPLRNNPFQIVVADFFEQQLTLSNQKHAPLSPLSFLTIPSLGFLAKINPLVR
jgi:hypothetical protein